jgi:predicted nucleic acid-binding protein
MSHRTSFVADTILPYPRSATPMGRTFIDGRLLPEESAITAVTLAELAAGPHATADAIQRSILQERLQWAEATFDALPFDSAAARSYGRVYALVRAASRQPGGRFADLESLITVIARLSRAPPRRCRRSCPPRARPRATFGACAASHRTPCLLSSQEEVREMSRPHRANAAAAAIVVLLSVAAATLGQHDHSASTTASLTSSPIPAASATWPDKATDGRPAGCGTTVPARDSTHGVTAHLAKRGTHWTVTVTNQSSEPVWVNAKSVDLVALDENGHQISEVGIRDTSGLLVKVAAHDSWTKTVALGLEACAGRDGTASNLPAGTYTFAAVIYAAAESITTERVEISL